MSLLGRTGKQLSNTDEMAEAFGVPMQSDKLIRPKEIRRSMNQSLFGTNTPNVKQKAALTSALDQQRAQQDEMRKALIKKNQEILRSYMQPAAKKADASAAPNMMGETGKVSAPTAAAPMSAGRAQKLVGAGERILTAATKNTNGGNIMQRAQSALGAAMGSMKPAQPTQDKGSPFMGFKSAESFDESALVSGLRDRQMKGASAQSGGSALDQKLNLLSEAMMRDEQDGLMSTPSRQIETLNKERVAAGMAPLSVSPEELKAAEFAWTEGRRANPVARQGTPEENVAALEKMRTASAPAIVATPEQISADAKLKQLFGEDEEEVDVSMAKRATPVDPLAAAKQTLAGLKKPDPSLASNGRRFFR